MIVNWTQIAHNLWMTRTVMKRCWSPVSMIFYSFEIVLLLSVFGLFLSENNRNRTGEKNVDYCQQVQANQSQWGSRRRTIKKTHTFALCANCPEIDFAWCFWFSFRADAMNVFLFFVSLLFTFGALFCVVLCRRNVVLDFFRFCIVGIMVQWLIARVLCARAPMRLGCFSMSTSPLLVVFFHFCHTETHPMHTYFIHKQSHR